MIYFLLAKDQSSFRRVLRMWRHLLAFTVSLSLTRSLNLQLGWKVSPNNTRLSHWGMLLMGAYWWRVPLLSFFLNISSLHLLGLHSIWLFILQLRNWFTRSADVSESFHTGATIVESSAYLKSTGVSFIKTSRSLRKTLNKYGPPTLPCVVPLLTHTQSQEWPLTEMRWGLSSTDLGRKKYQRPNGRFWVQFSTFMTLGRGTVGGGNHPLRVFFFFWSFFLNDKTSAPNVFSSCLFIPRAHFETSLVMVS